MKKQFGTKRGLKRHKTPEKVAEPWHGNKKSRIEEKDNYNGDSFEEQYKNAASQKAIHKESSIYDSFLSMLQSSKKSIPDVTSKRQSQKEGGESDSEEDEAEDSQSFSMSKDEDSVEAGTDTEKTSDAMESNLQDSSAVGIADEDGDSGPEDVQEASDSDQENELGVNARTVVEAPASTSSFHSHLEYQLPEAEVENLLKKKWKYQWDVPAFGMSNCKWVGTGRCFLEDVNMEADCGPKQRLYKHWLDVYTTSGGNDFHSSQQSFFFSLCNSYRDILHCNKKPFYLKGVKEDLGIMDAYIMHCLNHIFRTRDLVTKNDSKVHKQQEHNGDELLAGDGFLDHGFTRPKVLILLPYGHIAYRVVNRLIQLTPEAYKVNVEHLGRFSDKFGPQDAETDKPADYDALFDVKSNDTFMIGIKFTRKSIRLFSDFYSSDLIVASPVALLHKIQEAKINKEKDVDYLSSIEVLIIDHADVITMQNWAFLTPVLEQLNCLPSKQHGTDIMRIRKWYLDGHARFYRQSIILGYYANPDINASFNHQCFNYQGKVKSVCQYEGVLQKVSNQVRQIYLRFDANSVMENDNARFDYFVRKVFPKIKDSDEGGIMIFISSYIEYVQLRNFLKSQNASLCLYGDYTERSVVPTLRNLFNSGKKKIMLHTERFHFYNRYKFSHIRNLIIYSLPERKDFYPEVVNMLGKADEMACTVLFSKFDKLRLERIVGTTSARRMLTSEKGVFVFC